MVSNRFLKTLASFTTAVVGCLSASACASATDASREVEPPSAVTRVADIPLAQGSIKLTFLNSRDGYAAIGTTLHRTLDGGMNWIPVRLPMEKTEEDAISYLQFVNPARGWVAISDESIYRTEDGCANWTKLSDPLPDGVIYSMAFFQDGSRGVVAGVIDRPHDGAAKKNTATREYHGAIASTTDGGVTWQRQKLPRTQAITSIYIQDEAHLWALGWPGLYRFDNSERKWKEIDLLKGQCSKILLRNTVNPENVIHEPTSLFFAGISQGWLCFKNGFLAKTIDGGLTWCDLVDPRTVWSESDGLPYFRKIHFADSVSGWGLAYNSIYRTRDSGVTWRKLEVSADFTDMSFPNPENGWAIAKEGLFRITIDD